ncbi:MAG: endoglucanase [Frankiales bacterium]|nr:endoglucanase [Frankiales bacterium]
MNLLSCSGAKRRRSVTLAAAAALVSAGIGMPVAGMVATARAADSSTVATTTTFDSGLGSWTAKTGTAAQRVTSPTQSGTGALEVTNSTQSAGEVGAVSATKAADCTTPVAGYRYTARAWVRAVTTGRLASVAMSFNNAQGAVVARIVGQQAQDSNSGWLQPLDTVAVAPANATCLIVGVTFAGAAKGERHLVDTISLTSARGGSKNVVGPLRTSGNQVLDKNGLPVIFRGVNIPGLEGNSDGEVTDADAAGTKAWGANFVRLPLGEHLWLSQNCYYDPNEMPKVDAAVQSITSRGMVAMLDLHWHTVGNCGHAGQWPMPEYAQTMTFWKQVAARYKTNPLVAFDLYNEPHDVADDQWRNGGTITWKGITYRTAGMQEMYDAVRSTGATNLVMATGRSWGNIFPKTAPLTGTNIVYAIHAYTCPEVAPPKCTNAAPYDPSQFFKYWTTAETTYPIILSEFGWPNPDDGLYIQNVITYAEAHKWSWSIYSCCETWGWFPIVASNKAGSAWQARLAGMPALRAFPGA